MNGWAVARVGGPACIGVSLVVLRPEWVSVATLALLALVGLWLEASERRADDVEELEKVLREEVSLLGSRFAAEVNALRQDTARRTASFEDNLTKVLKEHSTRLDAMAQQRKGPML